MTKFGYFLFKSASAAVGIALVQGTYELGKVIVKKVGEKSEEKKAS